MSLLWLYLATIYTHVVDTDIDIFPDGLRGCVSFRWKRLDLVTYTDENGMSCRFASGEIKSSISFTFGLIACHSICCGVASFLSRFLLSWPSKRRLEIFQTYNWWQKVTFEYQVIRRPRRKTAAITVMPDGTVQVLVPASLSEDRVVELIERKGRWIKEKIAHFEKFKSSNSQKKYASGEFFAYLGRNYRLKVVTGNPEHNPLKLMNGRFHIHVPANITKKVHNQLVAEQLTGWYQSHAAVRLKEKAQSFAHLMGVTPALVGIKGYRSRWGTCHPDGRVYFNWRIIMAPHAVVDYVVVHELSHLVHHDHSKNFWNCVESVIPDYGERKRWLRANGRGLRVGQ